MKCFISIGKWNEMIIDIISELTSEHTPNFDLIKMKISDMKMSDMGLKEQHKTLWGKAAEKNAQDVRDGKYGKVKAEWKDNSAWMDSVSFSWFVVERDYTFTVVCCNETGVSIMSGERRGCSLNPLLFYTMKTPE